VAIAAAGDHSLALRNDGSLWCWGDNDFGLGSPPRVDDRIGSIAAGYFHSLALTKPSVTIASTVDFVSQAVDDGDLTATGRGKSATAHLKTVLGLLDQALAYEELGDTATALDLLTQVYRRCDGLPNPPDFLTGAAVENLVLMLDQLISELASA
jgi:hypothetical protein